jgi:glutamine amidotransferase
MTALIIDYGMGNLASVKRSIEECGIKAVISDLPESINQASHLILPGVGSFQEGMKNLRQNGWAAAIQAAVVDDAIPMLGICLGMQLLATFGDEGGGAKGLNLIPGKVTALKGRQDKERIPHVGWNEIKIQQAQADLFMGIDNNKDFYFVHGFHFEPDDSRHIMATTPYCGEFVSAVGKGSALGVQFHPEKSSKSGLQLLANFLVC